MAERSRVPTIQLVGVLEPKTTQNNISVALQFCSKRPVSNLTLTCSA